MLPFPPAVALALPPVEVPPRAPGEGEAFSDGAEGRMPALGEGCTADGDFAVDGEENLEKSFFMLVVELLYSRMRMRGLTLIFCDDALAFSISEERVTGSFLDLR